VVIEFSQCVARPDTDGRRNLLVDHLNAVAAEAGDARGSLEQRLGFLAGLLHDAGKCHEDWQDYIAPGRRRKRGPPHAPIGTALFLFAAENLIPVWSNSRAERQAARDAMLDWGRAVFGHHGKLPDLTPTTLPWKTSGTTATVGDLIPGCDLLGVFNLVGEHFPGFQADVQAFADWLSAYEEPWVKRVMTERPKAVAKVTVDQHHRLAMDYPATFARLIVADRLDAGRFADDALDSCVAQTALAHLFEFCASAAQVSESAGADKQFVALRSSLQEEVAARYRTHPDESFYTLLLPTGYGKTLTGLRVALEACAAGRCNRIIYVAPYLSILSQAAGEIARATGLNVFEHHHLSLAQRFDPESFRSPSGSNDAAQDVSDDDDFDVMDTWKAPVIATTFNQFFLALFPRRAQQTLRRAALLNAFVIVDEPQIIDVTIWNLFLRGLEAVTAQCRCPVLFCTATLPPTQPAIQQPPRPLATEVPKLNRYAIRSLEECLDVNALTRLAARRLADAANVAIVLNTVRDAATMFRALNQELSEEVQSHCLTAMMLPGHKHASIQAIRQQLQAQRQDQSAPRVVVVSTQILEAGVDLSFRVILRARSIFPSMVQVAGRANRHNEASVADVYVFPFAADGEHELRRFVYRDRTALAMTDRLLQDTPTIGESAVSESLDAYFRGCWNENAHGSCLQRFTHAALGDWSRLADIEPFGFSYPGEEIFVPTMDIPMEEHVRKLVDHFAPQGPHDLLERYLDPAERKTWDFRERKLMNLALRQFIVPARRNVAERIAEPVNDWLWLISDVAHYSAKTGLAHWLEDEQINESTTLLI